MKIGDIATLLAAAFTIVAAFASPFLSKWIETVGFPVAMKKVKAILFLVFAASIWVALIAATIAQWDAPVTGVQVMRIVLIFVFPMNALYVFEKVRDVAFLEKLVDTVIYMARLEIDKHKSQDKGDDTTDRGEH